MSFNPNGYWVDRGRTYWNEERLNAEFFRVQEQFIADTISEFRPLSIVEVGCGYGRITKVLADRLPETKMLGVDLSVHQIDRARTYCTSPNVQFECGDVCWYSDFPQTDLVLAVEFFLHIPPRTLIYMLDRLIKITPILIHDYDREWGDASSQHVFNHDYRSLYNSLGLKCREVHSTQHSLMVVEC
jgi:2-polyprenyl-3-methyl-5-hydroxy-6-metoxy-1,4-benzoquinol methylase